MTMKQTREPVCPICSLKFPKLLSMINHLKWHDLPEYKKFQSEYSKKISIANIGSKNGQWKGNDVSQKALHDYIKYHFENPGKCEICGSTKFVELSNKSNLYFREFKDWEWVCRRCHMTKDGRINNLRQFKPKKIKICTI